VARAARHLGVNGRTWEIGDGVEFDLTAAATQRRLRQDIAGGRLIAAMLAPPCGSFGPAGNRRKPVRSREHPWGKPAEQLTSREQERVAVGNATLRAALRIIAALQRAGVPWIFEHPHASFAFQTPEMQRILAAQTVHVRVLDQCRFGAKWRKRTRLVCGNLSEQDTEKLGRLCTGGGGFCGSGVRHWVLEGNCGGQRRTAIAAAYPARMARALAQTLLAPIVAEIFNGLRTGEA